MPKKEANKVELEKRLDEVEKLLLQDALYSQIVRYTANRWGIKSRQTDTYISKVYKRWKQRTEPDRKNLWNKAVNKYKVMFQEANSEGDLHHKIEIQKEINKLQGLYPADKVSMEVKQVEASPMEIAINRLRGDNAKDNSDNTNVNK